MKDDLTSSQAFSEQVVQPTMQVSSETNAHDLDCALRAAKHLRTAIVLLEAANHSELAAKVKPLAEEAKKVGSL